MKQNPEKRKLGVYIPLALVIAAILAGAYYWYQDYSSYITTDDAHVDADNVTVGTKMLGRIAALYANEGDFVKQGTLLAVLDSSDLIAQKNQVLALKAQALTNLAQAEVRYISDQKGLKVLEINLAHSANELTRAKSQYDGGVITSEKFDLARKMNDEASARLDAGNAQLQVSKSTISSASAAVETSDAQLEVINTQLRNTRLYAPADGVIAKRWLMAGDVIQPGQSVFTVTIGGNLWVVAFFEETKISEIHNGQKVKFSIDAFPEVRFNGTVFLTGSSTASVFSLIPANNASGNFTKVTQRIPVKISIDSAADTELSSLNILSGMSAVVKVIRK